MFFSVIPVFPDIVSILPINPFSFMYVLNVENFDDTSMKIETVMGDLELKGSGIHITKFDTEAKELAIEGEFDSVEYTDNETPKGGFLSRLFG